MKKILAIALALAMVLSMAACAKPAEEASADVPMNYISIADAKELLEDDGYLFFDVRKAADSSAATIPGALAYDMDAAKEGDAEAGKATMTAATEGVDKNLILVCYSGKRYAQATTNALSAIGYDMSKVFTLEGGFTAWSEAYPELIDGELPAPEAEAKVYNVVNLVNGNLGDKSFFDSAESGLAELAAAGRITYKTIEMGGTDEDQPKWLETLYEVSESGEYDLVICGTYQMPDYLKEVATAYPDQKYLIYDDTTYVGENSNVVNFSYRQNDMGYLIGVFAGMMTKDTSVTNINEESVVGFVGGVDSPVINDFLLGFLEGAKSVNADVKVDTRYVNSYVDTATAKELALSMINDNACDIIWGVAGNSGNGAAEAAQETGKAWFIGVDSDQELTLSSELASITFTSGLKNIGQSLIWFFDQWDAGAADALFGTQVNLGIAEGGVGIVTDKNFATYASDDIKAAVEQAQADILAGSVVVPSAIGDTTGAAEALRDSMQP